MHPTNPEPGRRWAIVELMGHAAIAGEVSEETRVGRVMLRVDVPEVCWREREPEDGQMVLRRHSVAAHTRWFGAEAIYSITECDQAAAQALAERVRYTPIKPWELAELIYQMPLHMRRSMLLDDGADGSTATSAAPPPACPIELDDAPL
jgi:hypothetical protein